MLNVIIAPIIVFAIIVIVHEGGHFFMGKLTGMKVDEFAVGFGPKIVSFRKGETLYSLRAIPLGGYNKIAGMNRDDLDDPRAFRQRPTWAKLLVIAGGALFNILLAFFIFTAIFLSMEFILLRTYPWQVLYWKKVPLPVRELRQVIKLFHQWRKVERWEDIGRIVSDKAGRVLSVVIDSEGVKKTVTVIPKDNGEGRAIMGITPSVEKEDVSLDRAVSLGAERCVYILKMMVAGLADILAGAEAGVAGPIGVARMAGTVADSGMTALFAFIALLSLNLGFLNLLPIPLLDGGLLILTLIEGISGKELPERALYYIQAVGIIIIGFIFLFAMCNDVMSLMK